MPYLIFSFFFDFLFFLRIFLLNQDDTYDKDFAKVIHDLDLDESVDDFDVENEAVESVIDNIKRDFDDEGDAF